MTAVAEALSYSPSAVSQQLATLEAEVGVELLERRGRGVVLTAAGRALVDGTDAVFHATEQATSAAQAAASSDRWSPSRGCCRSRRHELVAAG